MPNPITTPRPKTPIADQPKPAPGGARSKAAPEPDPVARTPPYDEALRTAHLAPGGAQQAPGQASTLIEPAGPTTPSNAD